MRNYGNTAEATDIYCNPARTFWLKRKGLDGRRNINIFRAQILVFKKTQ